MVTPPPSPREDDPVDDAVEPIERHDAGDRRHQFRRSSDAEMLARFRAEQAEVDRLAREKRHEHRMAIVRPLVTMVVGFLLSHGWNYFGNARRLQALEERAVSWERGIRSLQVVRCTDPGTSWEMLAAAQIDCDAIAPGWIELRRQEMRRRDAMEIPPARPADTLSIR